MGELADRLRGDAEQVRQSGGRFMFSNPIDLLWDLILLKRAVPEATILAADNPAEQLWGYVAYWHVGGREVSVWTHIPVVDVHGWSDGGNFDAVLRGPHASRMQILDLITHMAEDEQGYPTHQLDSANDGLEVSTRPRPGEWMHWWGIPGRAQHQPEPEPEPEPEPRTRWERIAADDEPL